MYYEKRSPTLMLPGMNPLTLLIASSPIIALIALFACWNRPLLQRRAFRLVAGMAFLLLTIFCLYGFLASFELHDEAGFSWRLRYLTVGSFTTLGALYFFLKRPTVSAHTS